MLDKVKQKKLKLQPFCVFVSIKIYFVKTFLSMFDQRACYKMLTYTLFALFLASATSTAMHVLHLLL